MIIISGASRGIGKFLLESFLHDKEQVLGFYNKTIPSTNQLNYYKLDITDESAVEKFISIMLPILDNLILINCAGINYNSLLHISDSDSWMEVIRTNLFGTYLLIKHFLPLMRNQEYGRIICMSSVVAQTCVPGASAYSASKAALWGLTKSIAAENARKGITANCINLGYFDIGMIKEVPEKYLNAIKLNLPNQKLGKPDEIFKAVKYLIDTDYMNGSNIDLNAGLY